MREIQHTKENQGVNVLVVDDQETQRQWLCNLLAAGGVRAAMAQSGKQALALARELKPHAVLLDLNMPGMDGAETAERLRQDPATAQIPIIMVTTRGDEEAMERCYVGGCNDYLLKPVQREELLSKLADILGHDIAGMSPGKALE